MATLSPSGSAGAVVEITNPAIAAASSIIVASVRINPGIRAAYTFPDGTTNITFQVRQYGQFVRFFSALNATGYFTTNAYSSGAVNTKNVTFCWENDTGIDIELTYWGPPGIAEGGGFILLETGNLLSL